MNDTPTVVNLFAGIHGCSLGFKRAGFRSLAAIDFDEKACEQGRRLTGSPTFCRDIAAMQPGELRELVGPVAPDVRQAAGAVVDSRGWPLPTHELVIEDGAMVLYGPPIDLASKRSCCLVIRAPDGTSLEAPR